MDEHGTTPASAIPGTPKERAQEVTIRRALEKYYRSGSPPWDSGISPPELVAVVEGEGFLRPGRALDLGCGTGTNAVYLAQHGWDVVAVDLIDRAIEQARDKADAAGVALRLVCGDVTRLDELGVSGSYDLFFDLSCFCGLPTHRRDAYADGVTHRAAPGARLLMFGYAPGVLDEEFSGVTAAELKTRFADWDLIDTTPGTNEFPTYWFTLRRRATPA